MIYTVSKNGWQLPHSHLVKMYDSYIIWTKAKFQQNNVLHMDKTFFAFF